jgi:hypothetical protein
MDGKNESFLENPTTLVESPSFPKDDYIREVDPEDLLVEENNSSKPIAQTKSKFAFPFGAQISTPCTYGVF